MKVIFVVDNIANLTEKVDIVKKNFSSDIIFIVNSPFVDIVKSYGYTVGAVYTKQIARAIHSALMTSELDDVVIYYSSLALSQGLITKFTAKIGDKKKVVNVVPRYNVFEQAYNGLYNVYVKGVFKNKDNLASPKLQFLPADCVKQLLDTHFANKMFEFEPKLVKAVHVEDKNTSKMLKTKHKFNFKLLIPLLAALAITLAWVVLFAFVKPNYLLILLFVVLYIIDIIIGVILNFKYHFDNRFLY